MSCASPERADFPHDNYWVKATVEFSDGSQLNIPLVKSAKPQSVAFEPNAGCAALC